jgi:hypothetical protein
MHNKLLELFEGDSGQFIKVTLTGGQDERGKREADYLTFHEPVTADLWQDHLEGKYVIGLRPERDDKIKWGCIDVDPQSYKDYSSKKYIDIIKNNNLPLIPVRSKSGGLHIFLFLKDWENKVDVLKILNKWNNDYFMANEVFPMNKALGMPYFNAKMTTEFAYNNDGTPIMLEAFIELAQLKQVSLEQIKNFKATKYEPESSWRDYPPCVQKMIQEKWSGNHRNDFLFNVLVLECKKDESLSIEELIEIGRQRNTEIFATPLPEKEVITTAKSVKKGGYFYKCPPKLNAITPICNKDLCKNRSLGIFQEAPAIIDEFEDVMFIRDIKESFYRFKYLSEEIICKPEDMASELNFKKKLLNYKILWKNLPKRKNISVWDLFLDGLIKKAQESSDFNYQEHIDDIRYQTLKEFFEDTIEQDDFKKLKDGYVVLESKTNVCYFKRTTLDNWMKKKMNKAFNNSMEALRLLNCKRLEYHEGEKNIWAVDMPEFINHQEIKKQRSKKVDNTLTEMDDGYHTGKFRDSKTKTTTQKDD